MACRSWKARPRNATNAPPIRRPSPVPAATTSPKLAALSDEHEGGKLGTSREKRPRNTSPSAPFASRDISTPTTNRASAGICASARRTCGRGGGGAEGGSSCQGGGSSTGCDGLGWGSPAGRGGAARRGSADGSLSVGLPEEPHAIQASAIQASAARGQRKRIAMQYHAWASALGCGRRGCRAGTAAWRRYPPRGRDQ
jgi:hypothetical protein